MLYLFLAIVQVNQGGVVWGAGEVAKALCSESNVLARTAPDIAQLPVVGISTDGDVHAFRQALAYCSYGRFASKRNDPPVEMVLEPDRDLRRQLTARFRREREELWSDLRKQVEPQLRSQVDPALWLLRLATSYAQTGALVGSRRNFAEWQPTHQIALRALCAVPVRKLSELALGSPRLLASDKPEKLALTTLGGDAFRGVAALGAEIMRSEAIPKEIPPLLVEDWRRMELPFRAGKDPSQGFAWIVDLGSRALLGGSWFDKSGALFDRSFAEIALTRTAKASQPDEAWIEEYVNVDATPPVSPSLRTLAGAITKLGNTKVPLQETRTLFMEALASPPEVEIANVLIRTLRKPKPSLMAWLPDGTARKFCNGYRDGGVDVKRLWRYLLATCEARWFGDCLALRPKSFPLELAFATRVRAWNGFVTSTRSEGGRIGLRALGNLMAAGGTAWMGSDRYQLVLSFTQAQRGQIFATEQPAVALVPSASGGQSVDIEASLSDYQLLFALQFGFAEMADATSRFERQDATEAFWPPLGDRPVPMRFGETREDRFVLDRTKDFSPGAASLPVSFTFQYYELASKALESVYGQITGSFFRAKVSLLNLVLVPMPGSQMSIHLEDTPTWSGDSSSIPASGVIAESHATGWRAIKASRGH